MHLQPICWRSGWTESYPMVGETRGDGLIGVARGVPSETVAASLTAGDSTTWFTTWTGAVEDSWWVRRCEESSYIEIGTVRLVDALDLRNGFATVHPGGVHVHAFFEIDRPTDDEWARSHAETMAMVVSSQDLSARLDEIKRNNFSGEADA